MKKIIALMLVSGLIFSLAACGNAKEQRNENISPETAISKITDSTESIAATEPKTREKKTTENVVSEKTDFSVVKDFDDFIEKMDESGFKTKIEKIDDKHIEVELKNPATDDKPAKPTKPAIPTIDKVKPSKDKEQTTSKPQKPESEENTQKTEEKPDDTKETESTPEVKPESKPTESTEEKKPVFTYTTGQKHTKLPCTERYLYSLLNEEQKGWYRAIDEAVTNLRARAEINAPLSLNRNYYIYFLYMFDNPEHFYLGNTVTIFNYGENQGALVFCYSDGEMTCRYGGELKEINDELRTRIRNKQAIFNKELNRILGTIPADAPDVWKERLIYDRILTDSHYNLSAKWDGIANDNWTAYGILVNKYGVCESYSEAFQTLCLYAGINCTGVVGTAGGGHKWNCVELDGEWYMCDITFDDPIGGEQGAAYHYYFNLTSAKMIEFNHDWSNSEWPVPECVATKYGFYNYFNK